MAHLLDLVGELTFNLVGEGYTVKWYPDMTWKRKFRYNTNICHEDDMGEDLERKTVDELVTEITHMEGSALVLLLHKVNDDSGRYLLHYDAE